MDHAIVHFEIVGDDPEALAQFYTELLGWKIEKMPGYTDYWGIDTGGEGPMGGMMKRQAPEQTGINYVAVEDVDEYAEKARSLGAQVIMGRTEIPGMGWFAVIIDPQGNPFGVWQCMEQQGCCCCCGDKK